VVIVPVHVAVAPVPTNVHVTPAVATLLPKLIVPVGVVGVALVSVTVTVQSTFELYNTVGDGMHAIVVMVGCPLAVMMNVPAVLYEKVPPIGNWAVIV
jgi:hypothetical protein